MSQIEQCALYLHSAKLPISKFIKNVRSDGGLLRKASYFELTFPEAELRLNVMPDNERTEHLQAFAVYVLYQKNGPEAQELALSLLAQVKNVLGVELSQPISVDSDAFRHLLALAAALKGFLFVADSILLTTGDFLIGPLADVVNSEPVFYDDLKPEDYRHEGDTTGIPPERVAWRERHYLELARRGFRSARWLPLAAAPARLRPQADIVQQVNALNVLFHWVAVPQVEAEVLTRFVENNVLLVGLSPDEQAIFKQDRESAQREHGSSIGWRLENMWALCWVLGFEHPPLFYVGQLPEEMIREMVMTFLPGFEQLIDMPSENMRSADEVERMQDLFYCAHNAVRTAQFNRRDAVPQSFHPIRDGGAVHERRHALRWCLSPGVHWDDVALDT